MSSHVTLPLWLFAAIALLALAAIAHYLFMPGLRWLVRYRINAVITDVNSSLRVELPTLQLNSRDLLIDRLAHDPEVRKVVDAEAEKRGASRTALMAEAANYAREIVPAFNAFFYFRLGYKMARAFLRTFYKVKLGFAHEAALAPVPPNTAIVFFINHRSNMDYLLVNYLASRSAALSYGAGEWCRVWPFRSVMRLAGAYILRRNSSDPLYRKVLERYVQIATESCVPHAIFGQGHLSRDGAVSEPKLGLIGYITKNFDVNGPQDILFIPVATNFDRVVEERTLVANAKTDFRDRSAVFVLASTSGFVLKQIWRKMTGNWAGFGTACANFGEPVSLKAWSKRNKVNFCELEKAQLFASVERLGAELTEKVVNVMPVLPVPAAAMVLLEADGPVERTKLVKDVRDHLERLRTSGAHIAIGEGEENAAIEEGLSLMTHRGLIRVEDGGSLVIAANERPLLEYYANSISQLQDQLRTQRPAA